MTNPYTFTDNPMVSGVSVCNTDIVNDNIMALKWMHDHISFRSIGEIVTSTIPLVDSGLHLLDGANIESGSYANFVSYIANLYNSGDYPDLFTTESDWQSTVTQYGVCGKFVYDAVNNAVRLPKITGIIEGTTDVTALGDLVQAGLPNIQGTLEFAGTDGWANYTGAFLSTTTEKAAGKGHDSGTNNARVNAVFDASDSSSTYGKSTTVQPQTIKVLYYIVIGTSVKTDIQVDIDEIATDLNGKADTDLSNVPENRGILVEKSSKDILPRWYRVYADGWCEQGGSFTCTSAGQILTYLKSFIDTNYTMSASGGTNKFGTIAFFDRTTTQCACWISDDDSFNAGVIDWQACGYIR
jgi:hypothetical protein